MMRVMRSAWESRIRDTNPFYNIQFDGDNANEEEYVRHYTFEPSLFH